jgi:hypothetical protein
MPKTAEPWLLTGLKEKLIKLGTKVVSHGRYVSRPIAADDRRYSVANRRTAGTARARMTGAGPSALGSEGVRLGASDVVEERMMSACCATWPPPEKPFLMAVREG